MCSDSESNTNLLLRMLASVLGTHILLHITYIAIMKRRFKKRSAL